MPVTNSFGELMSVVKADDPDPVARGPFPGAHGIQASMRRAEIQKKGDFGRGDVPLLNRYAQVARTREVAVDIGAKARLSGSLRCLPLAQFGSVFAGFHERRFPSIADVPQKSRLRYHRPRPHARIVWAILERSDPSRSPRFSAVKTARAA